MTTAAELRTVTEKLALDKAVKSVNDALANAPFGLEISQIMNNCRLSHKTTKKVLEMIKAENNNGVWSSVQSDETKIQIFKIRPTETKKVEAMAAPVQKKSEQQVKYLTRLINLFKANTKGISLADALIVLGGERKRFDQELIRVRRYHFPVRLITVDNQRLYVPALNEKPEPHKAVKSLPNDSHPKTYEQPQNPDIPEVQNKILEFRGMVHKRMTITKEVYLNSEQLDNVLMDVFGLDTVTWTNKDGQIQVHLTKTEVA